MFVFTFYKSNGERKEITSLLSQNTSYIYCISVTRTLKTRADAKAAKQVHEENGDLEVRRSRYTTTNQSVLFDALITK